jgi:hypothetical protein
VTSALAATALAASRLKDPAKTARRWRITHSVEAGGERLDAKRGDARRSQLDRQRDAIKPPADRRDHVYNAPLRRKMRVFRPRSLDKQPNGAVSQSIVLILGILRRHGQWWHRVDLLPLRPERLAAGGDDVHRRARPQHRLGHHGRGVDHMLAGVQHQQQPTRGEGLRDALR